MQDKTWWSVSLGGYTLPGNAELSVVNKLTLDKGKSPGKDGASVTPKGREPRDISIKLRLWTDEQLSQWVQLKAFIGTCTPGREQVKYEITHPWCAANCVQYVYVDSITEPQPSQKGDVTIDIHCTEAVDPVPTKTGSPQRASSPKPANSVEFLPPQAP